MSEFALLSAPDAVHPSTPRLNVFTIPEPFEHIICGVSIGDLPHVAALASSYGRQEAEQRQALLDSWTDFIRQLWQSKDCAFSLRFLIPGGGKPIEKAMLIRTTVRPGTGPHVAPRMGAIVRDHLIRLGFKATPIGQAETLQALLLPPANSIIAELRQAERHLVPRYQIPGLNAIYAIEPYQAPQGTFLAPFALAARQQFPSLISMHLEPTWLDSAEGDAIDLKVSAATKIGDGRYSPPDQDMARAARVIRQWLQRLHQPFLIATQIASPHAELSKALAHELNRSALGDGVSVGIPPPSDLLIASPTDAYEHWATLRTWARMLLTPWGPSAAPTDSPQTRLRYLTDSIGAGSLFRVPLASGAANTFVPGITPKPEPEASLEPITLTIRFSLRGDDVDVIWESEVIGRRSSIWHTPYNAYDQALILKALDAVQYTTHPYEGPQFDATERATLSALGFWHGDRVAPTIDAELGQTLFNSLIADSRGSSALQTVRDAAAHAGRNVAYILRFPPEAIRLVSWPWELMHDSTGVPLLLSRGTPASFVRYLDLDQALPPPSAPGKTLRILALMPRAQMTLELHEQDRLARNEAWSELIREGRVVIEELSPVTPERLTDRLLDGPPVDVLHYYGHGRYDQGQGELLLDLPGAGEGWYPTRRLATLIGSKTRLVMLQACQSAMIGSAGIHTGLGPALTVSGVPAILAMQFTVHAQTLNRFSAVVYSRIARGESLQSAVSAARQSLFGRSSEGTSWYVPALIMRTLSQEPYFLMKL